MDTRSRRSGCPRRPRRPEVRKPIGARVLRIVAAVGIALVVSGCSVIPATRFLEAYAEPNPDPQHLRLCHGYACRFVTPVALSSEEWRAISARFEPPAESAAAERQRIGLAVAQLTLSAGRHAGLAVRQRRDLMNAKDPSQLDCVDETVNTTTYLVLLSRAGLLRWHTVGAPAHRGTLATLDVANTPVLVENGTGKGFAVDTAFADPGLPPYIVPIETWLAAVIPEYRQNAAL